MALRGYAAARSMAGFLVFHVANFDRQPCWYVQVAFNMFIPCMLFTKVASTLSAKPDVSLLALPALAIIQVPSQPGLDPVQ